MDQTDRCILQELRRNCRLSYETLSRDLGITGNSVKRRIKKLREERVIADYIMRLSFAMVDAEPMLALIELNGNQDDDEIINKIGEHPFVNRVGFDSHGWLAVWVEYVGTEGLSEISSYIRSIKGVNSVELNPLPPDHRGRKVTFTKSQLKLLKVLQDDPRMSISSLAQLAGMTTKRTRRVLKELQDSDAVLFTARINTNEGSSTRYVLRLSWNEKEIDSASIIDWMKSEYPDDYTGSHISASEPRLFAMFYSNHIRESEAVSRRIQKLPSVVVHSTVIPYPAKLFEGIRESKLKEIIQESGV